MRQLLQNETENSYQKFVTKCDRGLLQSASGITKCDRLLLQSVSGITKCDRLLLQSAPGITKCEKYSGTYQLPIVEIYWENSYRRLSINYFHNTNSS